ncbi:MAG: response regulator [Proteobacteria bacterium]|nr:response regulator [Pseudomonadota bacterium]
MIRNVLIVDDDKDLLLSLKEGLGKFNETFSVFTSGDGLDAIEKLKNNTISLVVTDLKMEPMDGFGLLSHIMENYPDIPVIIITGYGTPEMERLAKKGGAVGYIQKPFIVKDLAVKMMTTLRRESDGGTLHNVSSGMFLQLVEMEQKTCTVRLEDTSTGRKGVLFFKDGELYDARMNDLQGKDAAYEIFSWEQVVLSIQNECQAKENKIQSDLQGLILDAMRIKDEKSEAAEETPVVPENTPVVPASIPVVPKSITVVAEAKTEKPDPVSTVRTRIMKNLGSRSGVDDIYYDSSWDGLISQMSRLGAFFRIGKIKAVFVDIGEPRNFILKHDKETVVVAVSPRCPRDRVMQILN